jgi:cob(I)alamin adenosyltransferase
MAFKIYTKTGDAGETGLFGGKRLPKSHLRIEAYGTIDELNAFLGLLKDTITEAQLGDFIKSVQDNLFTIGSRLASDPEKEMQVPEIKREAVEALEKYIDKMEENLPLLKNFILPGGHTTVSFCHIARCVCRRAERRVVALSLESPVEPVILNYLNRLSDFLFVLGRKLAQDLNAPEIPWTPK